MKKIAADRNYRILKRANDGVTPADKVAIELAKINDKAGSPNGTAFLVFEALSDENHALIPYNCSQKDHLYKPECSQELDRLLDLTQDALEGMTKFKNVWSKYAKVLFQTMNEANPKLAGEAMAWILMNNLAKGN